MCLKKSVALEVAENLNEIYCSFSLLIIPAVLKAREIYFLFFQEQFHLFLLHLSEFLIV